MKSKLLQFYASLPYLATSLPQVQPRTSRLRETNRRCEGDAVPDEGAILATGKRVVIIGGGDTGADCLGTSHRQKALSVHHFELLPEPPRERAPQTPWPLWPMQLRAESSHEQGGKREWAIATTRFTGDEHGYVKQLHAVRVSPPPKFEPIAGTETTLDVDLALLAMGFLGPVRNGMLSEGCKAARAVDQYLMGETRLP